MFFFTLKEHITINKYIMENKFKKNIRFLYASILTFMLVLIFLIGVIVEILGLAIVSLSKLFQFDMYGFKSNIREITSMRIF